MTEDNLTSELAKALLGWTSTPERFLIGDRRWIPRWRFRPMKRLPDALKLLDAVDDYVLRRDKRGGDRAEVRISGVIGKARGPVQPRVITKAVALAMALEVDDDSK